MIHPTEQPKSTGYRARMPERTLSGKCMISTQHAFLFWSLGKGGKDKILEMYGQIVKERHFHTQKVFIGRPQLL